MRRPARARYCGERPRMSTTRRSTIAPATSAKSRTSNSESAVMRSRARGHSYDVVLADEVPAREPIKGERADVERGPPVANELGDGLAGSWRVHETVAREAGGANESAEARNAPEDRVLVGRVLVEAGPPRLHVRVRERRHAIQCALDDRRKEVPVHRVVEAGLVGRIGHAHEDAARLPVEIEGGGHLHGERKVPVEAVDRIGDEDLAPERRDGQFHPGELR